jgi:hypothetical protein
MDTFDSDTEMEARMDIGSVYVWDGTVGVDQYASKEEFQEVLDRLCKKWTFQEEVGAGGYKHWQCRVSFKARRRTTSAVLKGHWSMTSKGCVNDMNRYVSKLDTRTGGPWRHNDRVPHRDIVGLELREWQQAIVDLCRQEYAPRDPRLRKVICVLDEEGGAGKSLLQTYMEYHLDGIVVPPYSDMGKMIGFISKHPRGLKSLYMINLPRAPMTSRAQAEMIAGVETLKDGRVTDWRYSTTDALMPRQPHIVLFMNTAPNATWLTKDRWNMNKIVSNKLVPIYTRHHV